ncbi:hypothetical protein K227x_22460 [Rubripirellula lacrimiformis]|uniref:Uncharacterized protein n=1 Tax=Rubripirellula lacrimiformis TaxID=1930273 RepID=A0A517N9P9_9BACT|nr:hypothetical protein [Rubripirellula lacrimiformis]QDT03861.1 hypothetical protein K227x_22460 [Rubripirellula lacrimiformis]
MHKILKPVVAGTLLLVSLHGVCCADEPGRLTSDREPQVGVQVIKSFPIRVLDSDRQPVRGAEVTPWALRSGQGHGRWPKGEYDRTELQPNSTITDEDGNTNVAYPHFTDVKERVRTTSVSVFVNHRDYAFPDAIHIAVPLEDDTVYEVILDRGVPVTLHPTIDGNPTDTDSLFAYWSEGRSWQPTDMLERKGSSLRLPPFMPGKQTVLVAKMDGDRITHFSEIVEFEISAGNEYELDVPLTKAKPMRGVLSDNVPRPVRNGRLDLYTLPPNGASGNHVQWNTWVPVGSDGTFCIDAWPTGERIELVALCDGYMAKSGEPPTEYGEMSEQEVQQHLRPQVFSPIDPQPIKVEMTPLATCLVTAVDEENYPVAGLTIESWPNVHWWEGSTGIYCDTLVSGERRMKYRDQESSIDHPFPKPFRATTDRFGSATIELPAGGRTLGLLADEEYELPITIGRRYVRAEFEANETKEITFQLQPKGTERLGDWDKLAGVVFGCSTAEGRRIRTLPGVREKMDDFGSLLREAGTNKDPNVLAEAYAVVASAFADMEDYGEASKWYKKASQQQHQIERSND